MTYVIVACNRKLLQKEQRKGIRLSRTHVITLFVLKLSSVGNGLRRYLMGIKKINQKKIITFVVWNSPSYYY